MLLVNQQAANAIALNVAPRSKLKPVYKPLLLLLLVQSVVQFDGMQMQMQFGSERKKVSSH